MLYYSTRDKEKQHGKTFAEAVLEGLASDGGLYLPASLPELPPHFFDHIELYSKEEIALTIAKSFLGNEIPETVLKQIVTETLDFDIPVVKISEGIYTLELFHGPTMAFKDIGARFMARVMSYFVKEKYNQPVKVIVATSGDTGSAVASGFFKSNGIQVYILYPQGKVSPLQEQQLTTWGHNIQAIEVEGSFDDCQALAKKLLADEDLKNDALITSANSINIARLVPQSFYYALAYKALKGLGKDIVISVPSGNFGNLSAGLLLSLMGMPVSKFIAATNANKVFTEYLQTGVYQPKASEVTISNAMDVGAPSNFERMLQLFQSQVETFKQHIASYSVSDDRTREVMKTVYGDYGYILDPHGAVGYEGLQLYLQHHAKAVGIFLETAHPAKFKEVVEATLGIEVSIPEQLQVFMQKEKMAILVPNEYDQVKGIIKG